MCRYCVYSQQLMLFDTLSTFPNVRTYSSLECFCWFKRKHTTTSFCPEINSLYIILFSQNSILNIDYILSNQFIHLPSRTVGNIFVDSQKKKKPSFRDKLSSTEIKRKCFALVPSHLQLSYKNSPKTLLEMFIFSRMKYADSYKKLKIEQKHSLEGSFYTSHTFFLTYFH